MSLDIVVVSRHTEIPERFHRHLEGKLAKVNQYAPQAQRVDVKITHEPNPRLADHCERIELTVVGKGSVVRAEASASDRYAALDLAAGKLTERLRRQHDRRRHRTRKGELAVVEEMPPPLPPIEPNGAVGNASDDLPGDLSELHPDELQPGVAVEKQLGDSPVVIRQKVHATAPMTVDDALAEMELVGHPFFLFVEAQSLQPAVVYRRKGWTYGVIRLSCDEAQQAQQSRRAQPQEQII